MKIYIGGDLTSDHRRCVLSLNSSFRWISYSNLNL